ncbi:MAG: hypothetical protein KatS3mg124_1210 [Porticoccaceae bacterium]|nr:MAG: hypothetical protein KatS3mg124_1210 [Porticoccaceae bacterium]
MEERARTVVPLALEQPDEEIFAMQSPLSPSAQRGWTLALGAILLAAGLAALGAPLAAATFLEQVIGWFLLLSGVLGLLHAWRSGRFAGLYLYPASAGVAALIGLLLVLFPGSGILSLTLLTALVMLLAGAFLLYLAAALPPDPRRAWLLACGAAGLVLGLAFLFLWPHAAGWLVGVLLGFELAVAGVALIALALAPR